MAKVTRTVNRDGEEIDTVSIRLSDALLTLVSIYESGDENKVSSTLISYGLCHSLDESFSWFQDMDGVYHAEFGLTGALRECGLLEPDRSWLGGRSASDSPGRSRRERFLPRIHAALILVEWLRSREGRRWDMKRTVRTGNRFKDSASPIVQEHLP